MSHELFELYVTESGVRKFVQDWIQTEASTWSDVRVTVTIMTDLLYRVTVTVLGNSEHAVYVRESIFGNEGVLTKKIWLPIKLYQ